VRSHQALDQGEDGVGILRGRSKYDDSAVASWWVAAQVADPTVEGEQHPAFIVGSYHDHGVHIVTPAAELVRQVVRQVLIELELHAGNGWISSRASAAP
jgi:hypothetical protein